MIGRLLSNPDRPLLFSVLFWVEVVTLAAVHVAIPGVAPLGFWPLMTFLALALLLWPFLPWRRGSREWTVSAAFVVVAGFVGVADGTGASVFLTLLALAHVHLAFSLRAGVIATAVLILLLGFAVVVVTGKPVGNAVSQSFFIMLFAAFVFGLTTALTQARQARDRADQLLRELAAAHEKLERYAERVHGLAVVEERTRMARDLHDSVGHYLTVIKVGLENAERYRRVDPDAAWLDVRQAKTLTGDALHEVRRWVRAMRPPLLDGRRGSDALRELARSFEGTGLDIDVAVDGDERALDEVRETVLFRVLQESLTNALRHSGGTNVSVRLGFEPEAVRLSVADDGRGAGSAGRGFGLTTIADRVREAGGALRTGDVAGGGFLVHVDLPEPA